MEFTSIKSYFKQERPKPADYVRLLKLLLQGLAMHAVEGTPDELGNFRREIEQVNSRLNENTTEDAILLDLGRVIQAMDQYNRIASRELKAYSQELKAVLVMMADTIAFLSAQSQAGTEKLQIIEKNLTRASDAADVRQLREKLGECLKVVREESVRLREQSQAYIDTLKSGVTHAQDSIRNASVLPASMDLTTGLPGRRAAEQVIANRMTRGPDFALALFMVDRLPSINGRFGRAAGDKALMMMAQHLAQQIGEYGALMRWSGPGFVALLEMPDGYAQAERLIKELSAARLEMEISTSERKTMVPLTCSFLVNRVTAADSVEAIFNKLDNTLALHS